MIAVGLCGRGLAQIPRDYVLQQRYGASYPYRIPTEVLGDAWTNRPWLGPVAPFARARAELEGRFVQPGFDPEGALTRLGREAQAKPADAMAQFRWATLGFLIARREGDRGVAYWEEPGKHRVCAQICWALALAPDPANAEYDRIRFIYEAARGHADPFRELGKRLALRWPDDDALRRNQAENLTHSKRVKDVDEAISIAKSLLKRHKDAMRYIGFMGDIYRFAWISLHRREDGLADLERTGRYLKLARPSPNRDALQRAEDSIRKHLG